MFFVYLSISVSSQCLWPTLINICGLVGSHNHTPSRRTLQLLNLCSVCIVSLQYQICSTVTGHMCLTSAPEQKVAFSTVLSLCFVMSETQKDIQTVVNVWLNILYDMFGFFWYASHSYTSDFCALLIALIKFSYSLHS